MTFERKAWLDQHVVPLLGSGGAEALRIYSVFWNGAPVTELLAFLLAGPPLVPDPAPLEAPPVDDPADEGGFGSFATLGAHLAKQQLGATETIAPSELWGAHVQRLLLSGFRFDFLREQMFVKTDGGIVPIFGGDGAPIFGKNGMVSVRLWKKVDGIQLIVQVGAHVPNGLDAAAAVKAFFSRFEEDPMKVCATYAAPFGAA